MINKMHVYWDGFTYRYHSAFQTLQTTRPIAAD